MTKQELLNGLESTIRHEIKASIITTWTDATNICYTFCRVVTELELLNSEESFPSFLNDAYKLKNDLCKELKVSDDEFKLVIYDASKEK